MKTERDFGYTCFKTDILKTIGYHTCLSIGNPDDVKRDAPYYSKIRNDGTPPFLGEGYYFWDNNLDIAHWWGSRHCDGEYFILEYELNFNDDLMIDLVSAEGKAKFLEITEMFKSRNPGAKYTNCRVIEDIKQTYRKRGIQAPYRYVKGEQSFNLENKYIIIFCAFEKNSTEIALRRLVPFGEKGNGSTG